MSRNAIWDDSFSFDNLPLDVRELKLCLFCIAKPNGFSASSLVNNLKKISSAISTTNSAGRMLDPVLIGTVTIRLDDLINKGLHESWYNVEPTVHVPSDRPSAAAEQPPQNSALPQPQAHRYSTSCTMRVKLRFCEEKVQLEKDFYKELCDYLMDEREHKHLCTIYEQVMPSTERTHLVQALLRFFIVKNGIVEMLKSFLITEIDRCADLSTLFRPASMSTSLMDQYMRTRCSQFLRKALEEPLVRILRQNNSAAATSTLLTGQSSSSTTSPSSNHIRSFELDPTKCPGKNYSAFCAPTLVLVYHLKTLSS